MPTEPAVQEGLDADGAYVTFRFPDPGRRLRGVRLYQEVRLAGERLDFTWSDGEWTLALERPGVDRMEYLLELRRGDGSSESVPDPHNPRRVPGAFGDKSVLELPGYQPPHWLVHPAAAGTRRTVTVPAREDMSYAEKLAAYHALADDYFETEHYQDFCASRLGAFDEQALAYFGSQEFDDVLVETVTTTFPAHEQDEFVAHFRGLLALWCTDEQARLA